MDWDLVSFPFEFGCRQTTNGDYVELGGKELFEDLWMLILKPDTGIKDNISAALFLKL